MRVIEIMTDYHRPIHIRKAMYRKMSCLLLIPNNCEGN